MSRSDVTGYRTCNVPTNRALVQPQLHFCMFCYLDVTIYFFDVAYEVYAMVLAG